MKDTRRDCEVLTAKIMAVFVRDQHPDWLQIYLEGKKMPLLLTSLCLDCSAGSHIGMDSFSERQVGSRKMCC
ncbi:hypothetical protein JG688_00014899 [Phytophthora aleatoria]|uniref:Uncharacterized protein n=1 Tax=Phytophthora aleatoria TaxID=2496075 RepID=A0A8J5I6Q4_9STRA|nr:hypothetical protein JG688_00014899 [Phytophthora aleatoria]